MPTTFTSFIKKSVAIFSFLILLACAAFSQTLKGRVTDAITGDPLTGATVKVMENSSRHFVQLDGTFTIKNLKAGAYHLQVSYLSYKTSQKEIRVNASGITQVSIEMNPDAAELSTVVIGAQGNASDRKARSLEKNADALLNVVSAKTIELSPDLTVANVMQRVSGVTIERSSTGEGRYPIIRGMEKRYINTLVNGIKIPSPDNKNRYVPLDLFPSEILDRLEVSKSLTPSMEADAIGGSINLVMKDAPSRLLLQGNFAAGYNNIFDNQDYRQFSRSGISTHSPAELNGPAYAAKPSDFPVGLLNYTVKNRPINLNAGLTIGNRLGKDKQFGFIVSGSYQNNYRGTSSTFFLPNAQPNVNNIPSFQEIHQRQYSTQSSRLGLNAKLDYQINRKNKISWYNLFVRLEDIQERNIVDTIVLNSIVNYEDRSTVQKQSIYNSTLQGDHDLSNGLKFDWSLVYSLANNRIPDQAKFSHQYGMIVNSQTGQLSRTPDILQNMGRLWMSNSDKDYSAYANITQKTTTLDRPMELKAGLVFRDKTRTNIYNEYTLKPVPGTTGPQTYSNINNAIYLVDNGGFSSPSGNNYTFKEDLSEAYVQFKWQILHKLEVLGGTRIEQTHQHYDTQSDPSKLYRFGSIDYTDILPSLQFKYALTETQNLRLAYYKALARPSFIDLIPDGIQGEAFKEEGNPSKLNHSTADNLDFRYEFFPGQTDQLLLGAFYKNIKDPIEYTAVKTGVTSQTLIPSNFGVATNYGLEAVITKYFGPFGISANYTFTKSSITTDKLLTFVGPTGFSSKTVQETRPLQGQSNHVGNLSLLYKNPSIGLDIQAAFVYTGSRIALVSPYFGLDYWQAPTKQIDVSFEKSLIKKFSLYGKINNLTNTPLQLELHKSYAEYLAAGNKALGLQTDPDKFIVQKDYFKTSFLLGLRYKL
eukprot:gene17598-20994_t